MRLDSNVLLGLGFGVFLLVGFLVGLSVFPVHAAGGFGDAAVDAAGEAVDTPGDMVVVILTIPAAAASEIVSSISSAGLGGSCIDATNQCVSDPASNGFFSSLASGIATCLCAPKDVSAYIIDNFVAGGAFTCGRTENGTCGGSCPWGTECVESSTIIGDISVGCWCHDVDPVPTGGTGPSPGPSVPGDTGGPITGGPNTGPTTPGGGLTTFEGPCEGPGNYVGDKQKIIDAIEAAGNTVNHDLSLETLQDFLCASKHCPVYTDTPETICTKQNSCYESDGFCRCLGGNCVPNPTYVPSDTVPPDDPGPTTPGPSLNGKCEGSTQDVSAIYALMEAAGTNMGKYNDEGAIDDESLLMDYCATKTCNPLTGVSCAEQPTCINNDTIEACECTKPGCGGGDGPTTNPGGDDPSADGGCEYPDFEEEGLCMVVTPQPPATCAGKIAFAPNGEGYYCDVDGHVLAGCTIEVEIIPYYFVCVDDAVGKDFCQYAKPYPYDHACLDPECIALYGPSGCYIPGAFSGCDYPTVDSEGALKCYMDGSACTDFLCDPPSSGPSNSGNDSAPQASPGWIEGVWKKFTELFQ